MRIRTDKPQHGFSLVELLLTMVLILCLAAASVFTFSALYRSANLDEGNDRFQSMIRFAQAEAATTGRKVRLQFVPARPAELEGEVVLRNVEVLWEADLLNAPGVFQTYSNKAWSEEIVNELVGVEKVRAMDASSPRLAVGNSGTSADEPEIEEAFPGVTFYPDGSCDSAQIVLASRNPEDVRRVEVRLSGLLGSMSARTVSAAELEEVEAELEADFNALFESSRPVSSADEASSSEYYY